MRFRAQVRGQHSNVDRPWDSLYDPGSVRKYYFDDLWYYDTLVNQWRLAFGPLVSGTLVRSALEIFGDPPPPRKGHSMIVWHLARLRGSRAEARNAESNDTQLVLFGGNEQVRMRRSMRKWFRKAAICLDFPGAGSVSSAFGAPFELGGPGRPLERPLDPEREAARCGTDLDADRWDP